MAFDCPRKSGFDSPQRRGTCTSSATNMPSSRLMPTAPALRACWPGHQRAPARCCGRARAARSTPSMRRSCITTTRSLMPMHFFHVRADHQDGDALRRPARPCAGRSRPWRPRRCRASARRGSAPRLHGQPLAEHDLLLVAAREVRPPAARALGVLMCRRSTSACGDPLLASRGRASRSARSWPMSGSEVFCGDRHRQHQAVALAVLRGEVHAASMASRGRAGRNGWPSRRIVPPRAPASTPKTSASARCAPRRPGRRSRGSRRAGRSKLRRRRRARDQQVLDLEHAARRVGAVALAREVVRRSARARPSGRRSCRASASPRVEVADVAAVAQHGDAIGERPAPPPCGARCR